MWAEIAGKGYTLRPKSYLSSLGYSKRSGEEGERSVRERGDRKFGGLRREWNGEEKGRIMEFESGENNVVNMERE